jgi:hypothetical protein
MTTARSDNLNLLYSGGSGGFFLLHLLLLSNEYACCFPTTASLSQIIDHQWNISDPNNWKKTEIWPDNLQTANLSSNLKKIYFYCNPNSCQVLDPSLRNLVLYTDYDSQKKLAFYKKANWFVGTKNFNYRFFELRNLEKHWQTHYNNIKDQTWPKCSPLKQFKNLPVEIQQELLNNPNTKHFLNFDTKALHTCEFRGHLVDKSIIDFLQKAMTAVRLQDIVNTQGKILVNLDLISEVSVAQTQFIEKWKSLHSAELLKSIGIDLSN